MKIFFQILVLSLTAMQPLAPAASSAAGIKEIFTPGTSSQQVVDYIKKN